MINSVSPFIEGELLIDEMSGYGSTRSGHKDVIETFETFFEWLAHFEVQPRSSRKTADIFNTIKKGCSIPGFFQDLNQLRHYFVDGTPFEESKEVFKTVLSAVCNGSESAMVLDKLEVITLKNAIKHVSGLFWSGAYIMDGVEFVTQVEKIEGYKFERNRAKDVHLQNFFSHKIQLTYLSLLKCITTVSMASISLISIFFTAFAAGVMFSSGFMLTLSSIWLALNFSSYFYDRMLTHWENKHLSKV